MAKHVTKNHERMHWNAVALLIFTEQNHRITGFGRDLCRSSSPTHLLTQAHQSRLHRNPLSSLPVLLTAALRFSYNLLLYSGPTSPGPQRDQCQQRDAIVGVTLSLCSLCLLPNPHYKGSFSFPPRCVASIQQSNESLQLRPRSRWHHPPSGALTPV